MIATNVTDCARIGINVIRVQSHHGRADRHRNDVDRHQKQFTGTHVNAP